MEITFDPVKRDKTLRERRLDFLRAVEIFDGPNYRFVDERMMVVVWTQRGSARHVISMRKANDREKVRYGKFLD